MTALFGGTFDPPHLGHRLAVDGLFREPGVKTVRVLPSPSPPHKPTIATADDRAAMAKLTFASSAAYPLTGPVEVDLCELERARPGSPTYTFDTLQELRRKIPQLAFVIGTDQLLKFHTWHRFPDVLGLSHWIILERKNRGTADPETIRQVLGQWEGSGLVRSEGSSWRVRDGGTVLLPIPTPAPALSSTEIRESLARSGNPPEGSILPEVHNYLMSRRLYGTGRA